ncbi:hypothetical protein D3C72_1380180 [compost metagenome]
MGAAQQAFGHGDRLALEIADGSKVALAQSLGGLAHQSVQRQGCGGGGHAAAGQGRAGRKGVEGHPADHAVATRTTPDAVALTVQDVKGFAVQQLIRALLGVRNDVGDGNTAMHGFGPAIGLGPHQTLQSLFGQHDPIPVPKDQRRAGRDQVEGVGQYEGSAVHAGQSSFVNAEAKSGVNRLGYFAKQSRR